MGTGDLSISGEDVRWARPLLDRMPALIGYWDRGLRNVFANEAYRDFWDLAPGEVEGRHIGDVLGEELYELNLPYISGALAGQEQTFSRSLIDNRGVTRYTNVSYIPNSVDGRIDGFYAVVTDVTERVEAERARGEALRMFQVMVANAPFGKAIIDTKGYVLHINPALCDALRYSAEELVGVTFRKFVHPDEVAESDAELQLLVSGAESQVSSERRYLRGDGTTVWMLRSAVLVRGSRSADDVVVAQYTDATERRHAEAELARMAITDPLTGLHNRRAYEDWITRRRESDPMYSIGIIYIDLNGFKQINDLHGHAAGDAILAEAARSLSRVVEPPSMAYRFGGDEFIVLASDIDAPRVADLAETITRALTGRYGDLVPVNLTASVGWTHGLIGNADKLLHEADSEMYRQKSQRTAEQPPE